MNKNALEVAYEMLQENCGIKRGDEVRVLRKAKSSENGWRAIWTWAMDYAVGNTYTVKDVQGSTGVQLTTSEGIFWFPFFVLEKVKDGKPSFETRRIWLNPSYTAEVSADVVTVGCQRIEFSAIRNLALAVKAAQEYNKS